MLNLKHGGHILDDNAPGAEETTKKMDDVVLNEWPEKSPILGCQMSRQFGVSDTCRPKGSVGSGRGRQQLHF